MTLWNILTGEYAPQIGGVSDYSRLVARELAAAGDQITVWAPQFHGAESVADDARVTVQRLPDRFGTASLRTMSRALSSKRGERLLVQYVPHAFGAKAMNLGFCLWLFSRREKTPIDVMFHEVAFPLTVHQPLRHNFLALVTRLMAMIVARSAKRIFVAIPAWAEMISRLVPRSKPIAWAPVPSNIPVLNNHQGAKAIRDSYCAPTGLLIGHFGTYNNWISSALQASLGPLLRGRRECSLLFIGRGSDAFRNEFLGRHPGLEHRVYASGELSHCAISRHLSACDLMVQPYPDGISSRRGSAMAALAHGRAMVTTYGYLTEPVWGESGAVTMTAVNENCTLSHLIGKLASSETARQQLAKAGRHLYSTRFDIAHTVTAFRSVSG